MMNNLFSSFDPSSSLLSLSWLTPLFMMILLKPSFWVNKIIKNKILDLILTTFKKEVKFTLMKTEKSTELLIISIFLAIISMNAIALFPQNFSISSHLAVNLPLSMTFWLTIFLNGWMNNWNHMLAHLVPSGTPTFLMSFMVLIEMTSNLIRPITLCVRLTANLIAGHLLMTLLGDMLTSMSYLSSMIMMVAPLILTTLETAVAGIQAYVFMTLITMYTTEIK